MTELQSLPTPVANDEDSSSDEDDSSPPIQDESPEEYVARLARERDEEAAAAEQQAYEYQENFNALTREIIIRFLSEHSRDNCDSMRRHKKTISDIKKAKFEATPTRLPYCNRAKLFGMLEAEKRQKELHYKSYEEVVGSSDEFEKDIDTLERHRNSDD
jgi:hypothetical protein